MRQEVFEKIVRLVKELSETLEEATLSEIEEAIKHIAEMCSGSTVVAVELTKKYPQHIRKIMYAEVLSSLIPTMLIVKKKIDSPEQVLAVWSSLAKVHGALLEADLDSLMTEFARLRMVAVDTKDFPLFRMTTYALTDLGQAMQKLHDIRDLIDSILEGVTQAKPGKNRQG